MTSYGKSDVVAALRCLLDQFATGLLFGAAQKTQGWTTYEELFDRYVPRWEGQEHLPDMLVRVALVLEKDETAARCLAKEVFVSWNEELRQRGEEDAAAKRSHDAADKQRQLMSARACYRDRREVLRRHAVLWIADAAAQDPAPDRDWPLLGGQPPFAFPLPWELGPLVQAAMVDLWAEDGRVWLADEVWTPMQLVIADVYAEQRGIPASDVHRAMGQRFTEVALQA